MFVRAFRPLPFALAACLYGGSAGAALSIYMSPEQLAERAAIVVEATVTRTVSGRDPATAGLATYVFLEVDAVHRGPRDLARLVVREPGGRFGDLVHQLDAVPVYVEGERVFAFLEPAPDGALRTSGMFFGKFRLGESARGGSRAVRDLEGQGTILHRPVVRDESFSRGELVASTVHADAAASRSTRRWLTEPPELARLAWDPGPSTHAPLASMATGAGLATFAAGGTVGAPAPAFVPLQPSDPARWTASDSGTTVMVNVDPTGNPLDDATEAVAEIARGLAAWSHVPESRVALAVGNPAYDYRGQHPVSPAMAYSGVNAVLFDDPYDDLPEPMGCAGVLALGGFWRSTAWTSTVNGVSFHPMLQLYVIFNDELDCYLADPENLAEVTAHELGHVLGFGHSSQPDSIMRAWAYGQRGPRLGDDDRDAAHCHYPHTLAVVSPASGVTWAGGSVQTVQWQSTAEAGSDPGTVTLEYSLDGGASWAAFAAGTPNDGSHTWVLPAQPSATARVRVVRYPRGGGVPAVYPAACSSAVSAAFVVGEPLPVRSGIAPRRASPRPPRTPRL